MKRYTLFIYAVLLSIIGTLSMSAQQTQDALYIFRNDGKFNAFFYADIDRIEYSKIDTLGVEHSDYVTQEVYALDSVIRIPISAIDSVAFVTPETKYKADVMMVDKSISDHIVASDSSTWFRLSASTPSSMIPKKGDKLVIEDRSTYLPFGIGGIVASVESDGSGHTVTMAETELGDIYDRLVVKFAGGGVNSKARTRAGMAFEDIELPKVSKTYEIEGSLEAIKAFKETTSVSIDGLGSLTCDIKPTIRALRAFLVFEGGSPVTDFFLDSEFDNHINFKWGGGFTARVEIPFGGVKESYEWGKLNCSYGPFVEISKAGKLDYNWYNTTCFTNSLGYSSGHPSYTFESTTPYENSSFGNIENDFTAGIGIYGKVEFALNSLANMGVKFLTGIDIGIRFENHDPVTAKDIAAMDIFDTWVLYEKLNKDDLVHLRNPFINFQLTWQMGPYTNAPFKPEAKIKMFEFGRVPNFTDIKWEVDEKCPWRGKLKSKIKSRTMWNPVSYGFIIVDGETQRTTDIWYNERKYDGGGFTLEQTFFGLDTDKDYVGIPLLQHHGEPMVADVETTFTLGPPMILMDSRKVTLPETDGTKTLELKTNIFDLRYESDADWFEATYYRELAEILVIYNELPEDEAMRKDYIVGVGYDTEGHEIARDTITVIQTRAVIKATPNPVEFDVMGGTETVIIETSAEKIEAEKMVTGEWKDFYSFKLNADNTLTVTVPENTTDEELVGYIKLKGTMPDGKVIYEQLKITQAGPEGQYVKFSPDMVTFGKSAGKQELISTANFEWYYLNTNTRWTVNGNDKEAWFTFDATEYDESFADGILTDKWQITVSENNWGFVREATIEVTLKDKSETLSATATITISQDDGQEPTISVSPSSVTFGVDGGTQELKITTNQPRFGYNFEDNDWLSAKAEAGGIIKLTAKANTTGAERSATITVYGANSGGEENVNTTVKVTQTAGEESGETTEIIGHWELIIQHESNDRDTRSYLWSFNSDGSYSYEERIDSWTNTSHTVWDWGWDTRSEYGQYTISGNILNLVPTKNTIWKDTDINNRNPQEGSTSPYSLEFSVSSDGQRLTIAGKTFEKESSYARKITRGEIRFEDQFLPTEVHPMTQSQHKEVRISQRDTLYLVLDSGQ